jgi:hypothetical protein
LALKVFKFFGVYVVKKSGKKIKYKILCASLKTFTNFKNPLQKSSSESLLQLSESRLLR